MPEVNNTDGPVRDTGLNKRDRILISILTFACCSMVAASWWYYSIEARANEAASAKTLFAIAEGKVRQIANWRRERIGDGEVTMSASTLERASRVLSNAGSAQPDKQFLRDILQRLSVAFLYSDATLVDLDGNLHLHLNDDGRDDVQFDRGLRADLARKAIASSGVVLSDLTTNTRSRRPLMSLTVPVRGQGAIILEIDPARFLYPYIAAWPGSAQSGETLLMRVEGDEVVDLSPKRYAPMDPILGRRPLTVKLPPKPVLDAGWILKGPDYRHTAVIATARAIPDSPWYLLCKIDAAEVDAPLRRLAWEAALLTGLIALINTAGGALIVHRTRERKHREREALFYSIANDTPAYLWMESPVQGSFFQNHPLRDFLQPGSAATISWLDRLHPDDRERVVAAHNHAKSEARGYTIEVRILCFNERYRVVLVDALPQFSNGRFTGLAGCLSDVTDRRRAEEQLRLANSTLQVELVERTRKEDEIRTLSARLINAREEERRRLARELHDGLNQQIAAVMIAVGNLKRTLKPSQIEARSEADRIHQRLVDVSESVRVMSHELHPALLTFRNLGAAVESCCDEFALSNHLEVSRSVSGTFQDVPFDSALCVYRILQESLQNVLKHSHADRAYVELTRSNGTLDLTVSDSGVGFSLETTSPRTGLGLISMEERVRLVGGAITIRSAPNSGTTLKVSIPLVTTQRAL